MNPKHPVWIITDDDEDSVGMATCSEEAEDVAREAGYSVPVAHMLEDTTGAYWAVAVAERSIIR